MKYDEKISFERLIESLVRKRRQTSDESLIEIPWRWQTLWHIYGRRKKISVHCAFELRVEMTLEHAAPLWVCVYMSVFVQANNFSSVYGFVAAEGHNERKEFQCNDSYRHHICSLVFPCADDDYEAVDDNADKLTFINKERCEWDTGEGNERRTTNRRENFRSSRPPVIQCDINNFFPPPNESRLIS